MPKVSVVIPFHTRLAWLHEAIRSVLHQTFQDFELILVDDASTEPLDGLPLDDARVRYARQARNAGASAARNRGIDLATGQYVAFLDSDDLFLPDKLVSQVEFMDARPEIGFTHTSYRLIRETGAPIREVHSAARETLSFYEVLTSSPIATSTVMARREILEALRFDESVLFGGEDTILWSECARRTTLGGIDVVLTCVRGRDHDFNNDPSKGLRGAINIMRSDTARTSAAISTLRQAVLYKAYGEVEKGLWREIDPDQLWNLAPDAGERAGEPMDVKFRRRAGSKAGEAERLSERLAEREAVIRDLHETLAVQAERFAAERSRWPGQPSPPPPAEIAWADDPVIQRDQTIAWLHHEVARRDELIERLHAEVADRNEALNQVREEVAELHRRFAEQHEEAIRREGALRTIHDELLDRRQREERLHREVAARDRTIEWLHREVSLRDDSIRRLDAPAADSAGAEEQPT